MPAKRKSKDYIPVTVPFSAASRVGELEGKSTREISSWANRVVWTDRMLNALTVGVRGGKWHALIDKVYSELNLFVSARKVIGQEEEQREWIVKAPKISVNMRSLRSGVCDNSCNRIRIAPGRYAGCRFPSREANKRDLWEFRRFETGLFKRRWSM